MGMRHFIRALRFAWPYRFRLAVSFLCALFALPMSAEQTATYLRCTERTELPKERFNEAWLVCGRRAGKSFVLALTPDGRVRRSCRPVWQTDSIAGVRFTTHTG